MLNHLRVAQLLPLCLLTMAPACRERASRQHLAKLDILERAEATKCHRVLARLRSAGVGVHGLPSCDRIRLPQLRRDEAVLSFVVAGGRIMRLWARGGGRQRWLPPLRAVPTEALIRVVRDDLEHGDPHRLARLKRSLRRLSRLLFAGVDNELESLSRLLVLPDGLLKTVPFHALPLPGPGAAAPRPYLVEAREVIQAPCLALALRRGNRPQGAVILTPGDASAPTSRPSLPGAAAEVEALTAAFPAARRLAGNEATAARLHDALTADAAPLVHFAGHGIADLTPDSPPELIFSQRDPPATVRSVSRRRVRAPVVVLAACTTAYAARFRDGARRVAETNLVEALLAAGAHAVVAASWNVKDRLSQQQMSAFYAHVGKLSPATALAAVQRREIKRIRPPHPRYWATYAVYGGWRREGWNGPRAYK